MRLKGVQKYKRAISSTIPSEAEKLAYSAGRSFLGSLLRYTRPVQGGESIPKSLRSYRKMIAFSVAGSKVRKGTVYPRRGSAGVVAIQRVGGGRLPYVTARNAGGKKYARPAESYLGKTLLSRKGGSWKRTAKNRKDVYVTDAGSLRAMVRDLGKRVGGRLAGWQVAARGLQIKGMSKYQPKLRGRGRFNKIKRKSTILFVLTNEEEGAMKQREVAAAEKHVEPIIKAALSGAARNIEKKLKFL